jgi:type I restriction enzyme R subunit
MVAAGMVHEDVVSTLGARLARLGQEIDAEQEEAIRVASGGKTLAALTSTLLDSIDPDKNREAAIVQFQLPAGQEPTDEHMDAAEQVQMTQALRPFTDPNLRKVILEIRAALDQVFDEVNVDTLIGAAFNKDAAAKAKALTQSFRQFIEENKDQIEALQVLYSRPYRAGLRYRHVKDLAAKLRQFHVDPKEPKTLGPLWQAYQLLEPGKVQGTAGKLVDIIALVRHAIDPATPLAPIGMTTEERYQGWLAEQAAAGVAFTADQRRWLDAVKDHIASNLSIDLDDFETVPFNQFGGLGRAHELFGDKLVAILDDLNARLAA